MKGKGSSRFIGACLTLLVIIVFIITVCNEISGYDVKRFYDLEYDWNHLTNAITVLAAGCAIFYVYHYLQYFAKIFFCEILKVKGVICALIIIGGMTVIALALIYSALWAAWIAVGWSIIGVLHIVLSRDQFLNENSKKRLIGEGLLYLIVFVLIFTLNVSVLLFEGNMYPYYVIFIVFLILTIRQHINTDFMLAKTGIFVISSIRKMVSINQEVGIK